MLECTIMLTLGISMINHQLNIFDNAKPYSFDNLVSEFKWLVKTLPDKRKGLNTSYSIADAALSAFSVFFMQSQSFLAHQIKMQEDRGSNNANNLFQVENIPSDNQIRNILDTIPPSSIIPMFDYVFNGLKSLGYFEHYRSINKTILIALDGVNYFSSDKIHCEQCNTRHLKNGEVHYFHHALTPVIVAPDNRIIIPLAPEFITPQDGHDKQDGEHAAAKRWLTEYGRKYSEFGVTILGDDLYSHQPICEIIIKEGLHFILTCKPSSHITLYENIDRIDDLNKIKELKIERIEGIRVKKTFIDTYRLKNNVPIRDTKDALHVNWCELVTTDEDGKVIFINSYITDHEITIENVAEIIKSGRTRWKIENENNNVLKNHGYNLEHNFGHGKEYLSQTLMTLNTLAFLFHTVLQIMDPRYKELRSKLPTRKIFFEHIKALTIYLCFKNWNALLQFMLDGLEKRFNIEDLTTIVDT